MSFPLWFYFSVILTCLPYLVLSSLMCCLFGRFSFFLGATTRLKCNTYYSRSGLLCIVWKWGIVLLLTSELNVSFSTAGFAFLTMLTMTNREVYFGVQWCQTCTIVGFGCLLFLLLLQTPIVGKHFILLKEELSVKTNGWTSFHNAVFSHFNGIIT